FQAEDGIRDFHVTGVQTCALPIFWLPMQKIEPTSSPTSTVSVAPLCPITASQMESERSTSARTSSCVRSFELGREYWTRSRVNRSEERRVGKECRYRWSRDQSENT